jgi:hypothetical protein
MSKTYVVTGTLTDSRTVTLDEEVPLAETKVKVIIEPLQTRPKRPYREVMEEIWARQKARGHVPPTREEVDAYIRAERDSWDERDSRNW